MNYPRRSGLLLHPTSLPGPHGIGSFDEAAYGWIDFLAETRQSLWQVLPLGPTGYGDSPYQSFSSFAGNPYLISLQALVDDGLLDQSVLDSAPDFPRDRVDYGGIYSWKLPLLYDVAKGFDQRATPEQKSEFDQFCRDEAEWLDEYALFMALKVEKETAWNEWPMALRAREVDALAQAKKRLVDEVLGHKLNQWLFYRQWTALKGYANDKGIQIVGDIPIYVAMDSADVWADPQDFQLDDDYQPTVVAGVPPDYFSETGQLWGNPIYRWHLMKQNGYAWWLRRIRAALRLYDIVRIDHFRGFAGYWEVPADEETAMNGEWRDGPGADFFETVRRELGELPIIAEDLGDITRDVIELRDQFDLPGMKILQFAFATDASHKFLPHNYTPNFVVYPGTHDNDTAWGWYTQSSSEHERNHFRHYYRSDGSDVPWTMLESAFASVAHTAIATMQDVLNLGPEARINTPGQASGNWSWRFVPEQISGHVVERLRGATVTFGRDPAIYENADETGDPVAEALRGES